MRKRHFWMNLDKRPRNLLTWKAFFFRVKQLSLKLTQKRYLKRKNHTPLLEDLKQTSQDSFEPPFQFERFLGRLSEFVQKLAFEKIFETASRKRSRRPKTTTPWHAVSILICWFAFVLFCHCIVLDLVVVVRYSFCFVCVCSKFIWLWETN